VNDDDEEDDGVFKATGPVTGDCSLDHHGVPLLIPASHQGYYHYHYNYHYWHQASE